MQFENLTPAELTKHEKNLIERADKFWVEMYGRTEASDLDKLRLLSRQGKLQDKFQHDIMVNYFRKQGLWRDGITTIEQHKNDLILKKREFGKKIKQIKDSKIKNMDEIIERAKQQKTVLEKIPTQIKEEYKINKEEILKRLNKELSDLYENSKQWIDKEIKNIYQTFLSETENRQNNLIEKAKNEIENLQIRQKNKMDYEVSNFSSELEAELTILDYTQGDSEIIKGYQEEIKTINQEINELEKKWEKEDNEKLIKEKPIEETKEILSEENKEEKIINVEELGDLSIYTIVQLKEMLDSAKIEYTKEDRKADLIEKLRV